MGSLAALAGAMVILAEVALPADLSVLCPEDAKKYQGWTIRHLDVDSPFDFISAVKAMNSEVADKLPLQKKNPFDPDKYSKGPSFITGALKAKLPLRFTTLRLVVVTDRLLNCHETPESPTPGYLDVEYLVYTAFIPSYTGQVLENQLAAEEKSAGAGDETAASGILAVPDFAYDKTRHGFGGSHI